MRLENRLVQPSLTAPAPCRVAPPPLSHVTSPVVLNSPQTSPNKLNKIKQNYNIRHIKDNSTSDEEEKKDIVESLLSHVGALKINSKKVEESSSSDDETDSDDEIKIGDEFVAKCPDKETKTITKHRKSSTPYNKVNQRINNHQSGEGFNICGYSDELSNIVPDSDLFNGYPQNVSDELIKDVTQNISKDQLDLLYQLLDKAEEEESQVSNSKSFTPYTTLTVSPLAQLNANTNLGQAAGQCSGEDSDEGVNSYQAPGSIDSAYFTTSPGSSVTCSPKQRQRLLSESSESSPHYDPPPHHYNIQPQPREFVPIKQDGIPIHENDMDIKAEQRIESKLKKSILDIQWMATVSDKDFSSINKDGNTKLMQHLQIPMRTQGFMEKFYSMTRLIKKQKMKDLLIHRNVFEVNALSFAALNCAEDPRVARFILDTLVELKYTFENETDSQGNTLLHMLAKLGESHAYVMAEFLNAKDAKGGKVLRVDALNKYHQTPLHVAVKSHSLQTPTVSIVRLLIKHSADVKLIDSQGQSPLHLAVNGSCDPCLVKCILQSPFEMLITNITDPNGNSPLHCAARRDDIPVVIQQEVIRKLLISGAKVTVNKNGEVPWSLVPAARRNELKEVFNK